jgi:hypothetical protein
MKLVDLTSDTFLQCNFFLIWLIKWSFIRTVLVLYKTKRKFSESDEEFLYQCYPYLLTRPINKLLSDHPVIREARVNTAYVVLSERESILEDSGNSGICTK